MPKIRSAVFAVSNFTISVGLVILAAGAYLLRRLDVHMYEHAIDFDTLARRYDSIITTGAIVCLAGCIGLALALEYKEGFSVGVASAVIGVATMVIGLGLFPIHAASGYVYFILVGLLFAASLVFLLVASIRYVWYRTHSVH